MDKTLGYLKEILSNYTDQHSDGKHLYKKLNEGNYSSEESFVNHLSQQEIHFLNNILPKEIAYAKEEQDDKRAYQLNEVYELLY
ncbi:sigma-G-dependent sporulation-specific acid-soluble spore protein CsgA [Neobacillus jeddahensis]|uniref:sigma-G-dependent sporulation-specific acid-soluble spore protein CsgA n=1 Tax=Neobacillus jeddahensis TaxID=1461580 RepID=UPI00058BA63F|nr:sigma-G-dependent sporulation-specific acid-soluble spore protein CsgA [Neobacillus jeddahensis]